MSGGDAWLDRAAARRWFERAAAGAEDPVAREVESRMASRLDLVKHAPARIVDVGCGAGASSALLRGRYPGAEIVLADFAAAPLARARRAPSLAARLRAAFGAAREHFVCADMDALPLASGACGMLWSNLALAWAPDPAATLREWHRVLEVGGLLMFTSYGPDTLKELRAAFAGADDAPHVHPFVDMHDLGDALVASGFADPVMDVDAPDGHLCASRGALPRSARDRTTQRARDAAGAASAVAAAGSACALPTRRSRATAACRPRSRSSTGTRGRRRRASSPTAAR